MNALSKHNMDVGYTLGKHHLDLMKSWHYAEQMLTERQMLSIILTHHLNTAYLR